MSTSEDKPAPQGDAKPPPRVRIGKYHVALPRSRIVRIVIGVLLILGGIIGFLPVLGFWMIPLGVLVLSIDLPLLRRWRRRIELWWARRRAGADAPAAGVEGARKDREPAAK